MSFLDGSSHLGVISLDERHLFVGFGEGEWSENLNLFFPSFYLPDFFLKRAKPWLIFKKWTIFEKKNLAALLPQNETFFNWKPFPKHFFLEEINKLKKIFEHGHLQKAVPYIHETAFLPNAFHFFLSTLKKWLLSGKGHIYGFFSKKEGMLGCTPEILFEGEANSLAFSSMACAGTLIGPENGTEKEKKEHELVIQGIEDRLLTYQGRLLQKEKTLVTFSSFRHFITPLKITTPSPLSFEEKIALMHPTPALGTYPYSQGKFWLENLNERFPRDRFGAPFGLVFEKKEKVLVAIRGIQWKGIEAKVMAGCGVINESDPEKEWQEALQKLAFIKKAN